MNVKPLSQTNQIVNTTSNFPKYLYHITSQGCFDLVNKKAQMRPKTDGSGINGIFFFEMNDFLKNWNIPHKNVAYELLQYLNTQLHDFILLKLNLTDDFFKKQKILVRKTDTFLQREFAKKPAIPMEQAMVIPNGINHVEYIITDPIPSDLVEKVGNPIDKNELYFQESKYIGRDFEPSKALIVEDILNLMKKK